MSSKYVPPALRNGISSSTTTSTRPSSGRDGSVHSSSVSDHVKPNSLVNTSLPAKEAPKLVPATLASLTTSGDVPSMTSSFKGMNLEKVSIYKGNSKQAAPTEDDFPTLGSKPAAKPVATPIAKPAMNFAEKAREWAAKQKEDERIAAEEAEKERNRISIERLLKEKEEAEEKLYKKTFISIASIKKTKELELERYDEREDVLSDYEEEPYESPLEDEEEDEEEQDEYHSHWDGRRYRDEY
jgi:primosomal protein N'